MSLRKSLGYFTGREFHEGLFSSPSQNASEAAGATASADNAEIGQEEGYVNTSEANLRNGISGLPPNPYFTAPAPPAPVNASNTTNFFSPTPNGANAAPPPSSNLFAVPQKRQAQTSARGAVAQ